MPRAILLLLAVFAGVSAAALFFWPSTLGDAEPDVPHDAAPTPTKPPPRSHRAPRATPSLSMPAAKPCLSGPDTSTMHDADLVVAQGLDASQVRASMNAFVPHTLSCLQGVEPSPAGTLLLDIHVGCDGRVRGVTPLSVDDWPAPVTDCVRKTLSFAPFPAHALPDGDRFQFPLRYTPP